MVCRSVQLYRKYVGWSGGQTDFSLSRKTLLFTFYKTCLLLKNPYDLQGVPSLLCLLPLNASPSASGLPSNLVAEMRSISFYEQDNLLKTRSQLLSHHSQNRWAAAAMGPHKCQGEGGGSRQGSPSTRR